MLKKILVFVVFISLLVSFYYLNFKENLNKDEVVFSYRDEFDDLDRDFWYVGEWQTVAPAYDKVTVKNGILTLQVDETDRGPFLLSKPFPIASGDVLTIKRRVKIHYANDNFTGGFAILQTDGDNLKPQMIENNWGRGLGQAAVLVEYVHNYDESATRPGRDLFRVLPPTWETDDNYAVVEPIFDDWIEEELIYDTRSNKITYIVNGKEFKVNGLNIDKGYVRVFTHPYGWYTGHYMKMDWIDIKVEDKRHRTEKK